LSRYGFRSRPRGLMWSRWCGPMVAIHRFDTRSMRLKRRSDAPTAVPRRGCTC
jgi:hypothetical protein